MIEAVMLVTLGFLCASLLALAALPSLARRADRLARRRAEAAFPLSLAEIAADRDHLRAELALRARELEQKAERGFAAKAGAMQEVGQRDMKIARLEGELAARNDSLSAVRTELGSTGDDLGATRQTLAAEIAGHAATQSALDKRIADIASLEASLAEARSSLNGTSADLAARSAELGDERATLGRIEALLAERETELAALLSERDALRVGQVESRTQILVLEGKRDELSDRLAAREHVVAETKPGLASNDSQPEDLSATVALLKSELAQLRKSGAAAAGAGDNTALRQEIVRIAERLMLLPPVQEAAE